MKNIGRLCKIDEFELDTVDGYKWKVVILGDEETFGKRYAEAHIKQI